MLQSIYVTVYICYSLYMLQSIYVTVYICFNTIKAMFTFIIVTCHAQRPRGLRRGAEATRLLGLRVWIPLVNMYVCLLCVLCVVRYRSLRRADHSSRGVLPCVVCLCGMVKPRQWGGPGPLGTVAPWKKKVAKSSSSFVVGTIVM
jgi:hypothetical protein